MPKFITHHLPKITAFLFLALIIFICVFQFKKQFVEVISSLFFGIDYAKELLSKSLDDLFIFGISLILSGVLFLTYEVIAKNKFKIFFFKLFSKNTLAYLVLILVFYICLLNSIITLFGALLAVYAIFYNTMNNNYAARNATISDLTNKATDHLKEFKDGTLASEVIKMQIIKKPSYFAIWDVLTYKPNIGEYAKRSLGVSPAGEGSKNRFSKRFRVFINGKKVSNNLYETEEKSEWSKTSWWETDWSKIYSMLDIRSQSVELIQKFVSGMKMNGFVSQELQEAIKAAKKKNVSSISFDEIGKIFNKYKESKINFSNLWFYGVELGWGHFEGSYLSQVYFDGADLSEAHFEGSLLLHVHFKGANLSGIHFEGMSTQEVYFEGANLASSRFDGADLTSAYFERANLRSASFDGAYMANCYFEEANLTMAYFGGLDSLGADFSNAFISFKEEQNSTSKTSKKLAMENKLIKKTLEEVLLDEENFKQLKDLLPYFCKSNIEDAKFHEDVNKNQKMKLKIIELEKWRSTDKKAKKFIIYEED